jgi:hypothetical protein
MRSLVFMVVVALKIAVERADTLRTGNGVCSFCRKDTAAEGSLPLLKSCLYDPSRSRNNGTSWLSGAGCLRPADALLFGLGSSTHRRFAAAVGETSGRIDTGGRNRAKASSF